MSKKSKNKNLKKEKKKSAITLVEHQEIAHLIQNGLAFHNKGQLDQASFIYEQIRQKSPENIDAIQLLGAIAGQKKQWDKALELFSQVIKINKNNPHVFCNQGIVFKELGLFDQALESYDKAIALKNDFAEVHNNRGFVLQELNRAKEALASYNQAIHLKNDFFVAYNNRALVLQELGQFGQALKSCNLAIDIKKDYALAYNTRGLILQDLGNIKDALSSYEQAIALSQEFSEAHWNRSYALLLSGDLENGFKEHEWRWKNEKLESFKQKRIFNCPLWLGEESLENRTILLHSEQGFGDTIQFCRYALLVARRGARVFLEVEKPLVTLLSHMEGIDRIIEKGSALPELDFHCPLLSLPLAFKTTLHSIPCEIPYIKSDEIQVSQWQKKLGPKQKLRIGIAWSSHSSFKKDTQRSLLFEQLLTALPLDSFEFICLQKELKDNDRSSFEKSGLPFFGEELTDFSQTAALIDSLDLVISTCTSIPHLSAALGKPTWILLQFVPDWRWMLETEQSSWYSSVRLFRQKTLGDWSGVFDQMKVELMKLSCEPIGFNLGFNLNAD